MTELLYGHEAIDFITKSRAPRIVVPAGGDPLRFNADVHLANVPEHMQGWARRWKPALEHPTAMVTNSILDKREWASLDAAVIEAVRLRRNAVQDLIDRGLTQTATLATMVSQWRSATERVRPSVSMDGRSGADRDRTDRKVSSVPVPIIRTDYEIGRRELMASRALGSPIDTFEATEAAMSVGEEQERMLFDGESSVVVAGSTIYGYTTHTARDTDTATNYGGGDFATEHNAINTVLGMVGALEAKRYYGPFGVYVSPVQYAQLLVTHTDGSGQTYLDRITALPMIDFVKVSDFLPDGEAVMPQLTSTVIDLLIALAIENREWETPDGQAMMYAVLTASVPRLKADTSGNLGVAHATGC